MRQTMLIRKMADDVTTHFEKKRDFKCQEKFSSLLLKKQISMPFRKRLNNSSLSTSIDF
jgi:hypothetical protein